MKVDMMCRNSFVRAVGEQIETVSFRQRKDGESDGFSLRSRC